MLPQFPLFVRAKDSGEIASFDSLQELQTHVERIDIENTEYEAWDRDGYRLKLGLQEPVWLTLEISSERPEPDQLHSALRAFANSIGVQFPNQLAIGATRSALAPVRAELEKRALAGSRVRRFIARFK
jgi:hypothetical protein